MFQKNKQIQSDNIANIMDHKNDDMQINETNNKKRMIVCIDVGTTNNVTAIIEKNSALKMPEIQQDACGKDETPSMIAKINGEYIIGNAIPSHAVNNPQYSVRLHKRVIGRQYVIYFISTYNYS